jgi:hypothetical protein
VLRLTSDDPRVLTFKSCLKQTMWEVLRDDAKATAGASSRSRIAGSLLPASLFLVSDDDGALSFRDFLPPSLIVSSPMQLPDRMVIHIDRHTVVREQAAAGDAAVAKGVKDGFAEIIALSACDVIVQTSSGFSKVAGQWGRVPRRNIRVVEGFVSPRVGAIAKITALASQLHTFCPSFAFSGDYHCREPAFMQPGHPGAASVSSELSQLWCRSDIDELVQ